MCDIAGELLKSVEDLLMDDERLLSPPKVKIIQDDDYTIGSTNIYPHEGAVQQVFDELAACIEEKTGDMLKDRGEIQTVTISDGRNIDMGQEQAHLLDGRYFEAYCYECRSITFIRLWLEKTTYDDKAPWISIDIDEIENSLWFKDR